MNSPLTQQLRSRLYLGAVDSTCMSHDVHISTDRPAASHQTDESRRTGSRAPQTYPNPRAVRVSTPQGKSRVASGESFEQAIRGLSAAETFMALFGIFLVLFALIASSRVTEWPQVLLRMTAVISLILGVNLWTQRSTARWKSAFKVFYLAPLIPIFFKTTELISYPLHGKDYDYLFIMADRMLFGTDPTVWLARHIPSIPVVIDYFQLCYSIFYILPVILTAELYRRKLEQEAKGIRNPIETRHVRNVLFMIVYCFLLSYAAYFFFPSIGPRFTLHDFFSIDRELPGLAITHLFRPLLNRGENIMPSMNLSEVLRVVTRDAFPSGHTDATLLTILLAFRYKAKTRWILLVLGSSLIFATVYLRYHYVIDVIGGALLCMITLATWEWMRDRMLEVRDGVVRRWR